MMKKLFLYLFAIMVVSLFISGCQAVKAEETLESVATTGNETDGNSDQEAYAKFADIIDYSAKQAEPVRREFTALIKSVSVNGSTITLSLDKIELTNNTDPQDDFYSNSDELIESVELQDNIVILADPYNIFKAVTADGLKELLADTDIPFHFYSVSGEISVLIEMMLP